MANKEERCLMDPEAKELAMLDVSQIGTVAWHEQFVKVANLNCGLMKDIQHKRTEHVKEIILHLDKLPTLVHMTVALRIWRKTVYPKIQEEKEGRFTHSFCYYMFYQEALIVGFLGGLLFHKDAILKLNDEILDVIDCCVDYVVLLISRTQSEKSVDFDDETQRWVMNCALSGVQMLACMAEYVGELSVSAVVRLFTTHDVPLLIAQLIELQPWRKSTSAGSFIYHELEGWVPCTSSEITKLEAQCWISLRGLLLHPLAREHYELTTTRREALVRLQKHLHEIVIDQIAPLIELRQLLCQLPMSSPGPASRPPLIIQPVSPIYHNLMAHPDKWQKLTEMQKILFFTRDESYFEKMTSIALQYMMASKETVLGTATTPPRIKSAGLCNTCKKVADLKCSRCKQVFYCSRKCQVANWPAHKITCLNMK